MDVTTTTTDGSMLHIYRVDNLNNSNCYGPVTAIEYCYNGNGSDQGTFNWTVLILHKTRGNNFLINSTYIIQSHGSMDGANCTTGIQGQIICCDVTNIEMFDLPINFTFGVTESSQESTHGAKLLGYHESQYPERRVQTIQVSKDSLSLSVGSKFANPRGPTEQLGLRMLWFVIGKYPQP